MRMRAAVLEEFGEPLVVQEIELAEPKAGEVLVRLEACGVCHTDMYTASGADPSGYAPAVLGHEGAGVVEKIGEGVKDLAVGDHVVTLFSPQCRECVHCLSPQDEPLHGDPRRAEPRPPARRHDAASRDGEPIRHFMGTSTFAEYTVMPEIALAKVPAGGAAGPLRAVRLRAVDRPRRGDVHGQGRAGLDVRRVRRRHGRARRGRRRAAAGRRADHLRRPVRGPPGAGQGPGRDRHLDRRRGHRPAHPRRDRRLRRRLHVRGDRARGRDAPGGRVRAHGLGPVHGRGRRRQGGDAGHRPALPDHRPARLRLVASAASRGATRCRSSCSATSTATSTSTRSSRTGSRSTRSTTASS